MRKIWLLSALVLSMVAAVSVSGMGVQRGGALEPAGDSLEREMPGQETLGCETPERGTSGRETSAGTGPSVIYEKAELCYYEDSGWPYLHDTYKNNTDKRILSRQYGMLAYDREGQPLKLQWYLMDSGNRPAFECLYESDDEIPPGEEGGSNWSLYDGEKMKGWPKVGDGGPNRVAYALYCDRQITFSDGEVWENPEFESWLKMYKGKAVSPEALESYYPAVQVID